MLGKVLNLVPLAGLCAAGVATAAWVKKTHFSTAEAKAAVGALSNDEWRAFKLIEKTPLTSNTVHFRFQLPDETMVVGLPVASCLLTRAPIGEVEADGTRKMVIRPYTPVSAPDSRGFFDLVVKVYPTGNMSKHFGTMKVGDSLDFKGPLMKLAYTPNMKKKIGMIAGGSGITPMLQVADEILRNPADKTEVSLLFANQSEADIICRSKIDAMAAKHPNFKVHYMVDKAPNADWKYGEGYINEAVLKARMPPPSPDHLVLVCGPPPMMNAISGNKVSPRDQGPLVGFLGAMGYTPDMVFKF